MGNHELVDCPAIAIKPLCGHAKLNSEVFREVLLLARFAPNGAPNRCYNTFRAWAGAPFGTTPLGPAPSASQRAHPAYRK
jgi:hypothetical protein